MDAQRRIVVGFDGSKDADRALGWACTDAAVDGGLVHVVVALPQSPPDLPWSAGEDRRRRDRAARLEEWARARVLSDGLPVQSSVIDDLAGPALVRAAREAAAVVVGSTGHSAVAGVLMGSVSGHLARHATVPVVVARAAADVGERRVVVGVGGHGGDDDAALHFGFGYAARHGVPLALVHAWRDPLWELNPEASATTLTHHVERRAAAEAVLDGPTARLAAEHPEVQVSREALVDHPVALMLAASHHAALVVVGGRGGRNLPGVRMGHVASSVLAHAHCSVVVAR